MAFSKSLNEYRYSEPHSFHNTALLGLSVVAIWYSLDEFSKRCVFTAGSVAISPDCRHMRARLALWSVLSGLITRASVRMMRAAVSRSSRLMADDGNVFFRRFQFSAPSSITLLNDAVSCQQ